jgi:hypothetical protein
MSSIVTPQSVRCQALLQQLRQRGGCVSLPLGRHVLSERMGRTFDQHAQDCVRVNVALANHADHLSKDVERVGSLGGDALDPADQLVHGTKGSVWHDARMANSAAMMQSSGPAGDDTHQEALTAGTW